MIGTDGEKVSGKFELSVQLDHDDNIVQHPMGWYYDERFISKSLKLTAMDLGRVAMNSNLLKYLCKLSMLYAGKFNFLCITNLYLLSLLPPFSITCPFDGAQNTLTYSPETGMLY